MNDRVLVLAQFVVQLGETDTLHLSGTKYLDVMVLLSIRLYGNSWEISGRLSGQERPLSYVFKGRWGLHWLMFPAKARSIIMGRPALRSLLSLEHKALTSFPQSVGRGRACIE